MFLIRSYRRQSQQRHARPPVLGPPMAGLSRVFSVSLRYTRARPGLRARDRRPSRSAACRRLCEPRVIARSSADRSAVERSNSSLVWKSRLAVAAPAYRHEPDAPVRWSARRLMTQSSPPRASQTRVDGNSAADTTYSGPSNETDSTGGAITGSLRRRGPALSGDLIQPCLFRPFLSGAGISGAAALRGRF
jgi:hypothetical protein